MSNAKIAFISFAAVAVLMVSKITGFFRDVALAYGYGTSPESDAYVLSTTIISLFSIFFTAFAMAFMPIYKELTAREADKQKRFANRLYTIVTSAVFLLCFAFLFNADSLVYVFAPGFHTYTHDLAALLFRIMLITVPFTFVVILGGQHLRAENAFLAPAAIAIPLNLILMASFVFLSSDYGIESVGWVYAVGVAVQFVWTVILLQNKGCWFHPEWNVHDRDIRKVLLLTAPILIGNAIQAINTIIDRVLASSLVVGSMAALNFSNKLALLVISIASLGVGNVCYSKMADLGARKQYEELIRFLRQLINILNIIVVPATVGMMVMNVSIVTVVFEYGAFDKNSSELTAVALFFYAMGLVGYSLRDIITRVFYSMQDSKTPMLNGIASVLLNVVLSIALVGMIGIGGLALATSISATCGSLFLLVSLRKKCGRIGGKEIGTTFLKCCVAASIMGIAVKFTYTVLCSAGETIQISLIGSIVIGMLVYGALIACLKIKEIEAAACLALRILKK